MVPQPLEEITKLIEKSGDFSKDYTPASLPVEYIDVIYQDETFQDDDSQHMQLKCTDLPYPFSATPIISARIQDAKILYDGPIGSKKFIELTMDYGSIIDYQFNPGDAIGVLVSNSAKDVARVIGRLLFCDSPDNVCDIVIKSKTTKKNPKVPPHIPGRSSARAIIRDCLDLKTVPKKLFLRSLAECTTDKDEKNLLIFLSSKEGAKLYNEMILEKRTFLDILEICSSCCPELSLLIEHLPRLKPRPYSIANSPLSDAGKVKLIFSALIENPGVATSFLTELANSFLENPNKTNKLSFYFRQSNQFSFRHEEDSILIGIGCGVSPFLGFFEHKDELMKQNKTELGSTWLFVGSTCQDSAVHRDDLLDYQLRGVLQHLYESFSRDPDPDCAEFKHVQDQLRANSLELVEQLTRKETNLYVCADGTKISKSIEECIKECLVKGLECSDEEAGIFIKEMRSAGRYREDIWV